MKIHLVVRTMVYLTVLMGNGALSMASGKTSCKTIPAAKFSVDLMLEEIKNNPSVKSVESALCLIPESIRKNYTLVHSSQSAQGSTPTSPRAIIYKTTLVNGRHEMDFAISFNGDSRSTNHGNVEVLKVNRNAKGNQQHFEYIDADFEPASNERSHVSESNPQACTACHGSTSARARPIWNAKGFFPEVYGRSTFGGTIANEPQLDAFKMFQKTAKGHPRYRFLKDLSSIKIEGQRIPELEKRNSIFAEGLSSVNSRRIAELAKVTPDYSVYKWAILGALSNCGSAVDFVPQDLWGDHASVRYVGHHFRNLSDEDQIVDGYKAMASMFGTRSAVQNLDDLRLNTDNLGAGIHPRVLPFFHDTESKAAEWVSTGGSSILNLRWLMEGRGISMNEWGTDLFNTGYGHTYYRFINGKGGNDLTTQDAVSESSAILSALLESDLEARNGFARAAGVGIKPIRRVLKTGKIQEFMYESPRRFKKLCDNLKNESKEALKALSQVSSFRTVVEPQPPYPVGQ